jgi:translation initiation factor 1
VSKKSGKGSSPSPSQPPTFHAPFAGLASLRDALPAREAPAPGAPREPKAPPRAVVRYERKGRGGKEATLVEQLALSPRERSEWLLAMKQALGCGGSLEGEALVLQGDQRARVRAWLQARGVSRISVG